MVRSSSVSGFDFREGGGVTEVLERTRSMPEEMKWRRTEAKRKREGMMMMNVSEKQGRVVGGVMRQRHVAVVSQGSGSSGVSESEGQPMNQVANISVEDRSPGSVQSLSNQNESKQTAPVGGRKTDKPSMKLTNHDTKEMMKTMMGNVPCVSTRGVGSKRIEGFLYQYRKGEEVRIVCVCHGSFLTPAEFVKHAGGGDVSHPLKHIVVSPSPLL